MTYMEYRQVAMEKKRGPGSEARFPVRVLPTAQSEYACRACATEF